MIVGEAKDGGSVGSDQSSGAIEPFETERSGTANHVEENKRSKTGSSSKGLKATESTLSATEKARPRGIADQFGRIQSNSAEGGDRRAIAASFDVGKAELKKSVNGWDPRVLLESVLATDLALLNGVPKVDVQGSASPEYTPHYNLTDSRYRLVSQNPIRPATHSRGSNSNKRTRNRWQDGRSFARLTSTSEGILPFG